MKRAWQAIKPPAIITVQIFPDFQVLQFLNLCGVVQDEIHSYLVTPIKLGFKTTLIENNRLLS
jgi:hypothetical protein